MFDNSDTEVGLMGNDYLLANERKVLDGFDPNRLTSAIKQDVVMNEIFASAGIQVDNDDVRVERQKLGALAVSMIQKMDDSFDNSRHSFKDGEELAGGEKLLSRLMSVTTTFNDEVMTIGELLKIIEKARQNETLYPKSNSRNLIAGDIDFLRTSVLNTITEVEKDPSSVGFDKAYELRRVTNCGDAALMFDLSYGDLVGVPGYNLARQKTLDMAVATSLADDLTDFTEDMNGERVNSFLAAARDTGEYDNLMSVFRTKGFRRQVKRGEVGFSENQTAAKLAPKAYEKICLSQKKHIDLVGSETFSMFYSIHPIPNSSIQN